MVVVIQDRRESGMMAFIITKIRSRIFLKTKQFFSRFQQQQ